MSHAAGRFLVWGWVVCLAGMLSTALLPSACDGRTCRVRCAGSSQLQPTVAGLLGLFETGTAGGAAVQAFCAPLRHAFGASAALSRGAPIPVVCAGGMRIVRTAPLGGAPQLYSPQPCGASRRVAHLVLFRGASASAAVAGLWCVGAVAGFSDVLAAAYCTVQYVAHAYIVTPTAAGAPISTVYRVFVRVMSDLSRGVLVASCAACVGTPFPR